MIDRIAAAPLSREAEALRSYVAGRSVKRIPTWSKTVDGLRLDYWRNRWRTVFEAEDFRRRSHVFTVTAGERLTAAGEFDEWNCAVHMAGISLNRFAQAADIESQVACDMATALFSSFCRIEARTGLSLFDFGSVVLFDRLRIEAASAQESRTVWTLINVILRRFRRMPIAGIVLKAFPLEYEGKVTEKNRTAFEHRQQAMMRYYTRRLGVATLPGWPGRNGWQWRNINSELEPRASRRYPKLY